MTITYVVFDSQRRTSGTASAATFDFTAPFYNVKKIWLKYFQQGNSYASALTYDYIYVKMNGPFGSAWNPRPASSQQVNNDSTFVIPYRVADTDIIFQESTNFVQKCKGTCYTWQNSTINVYGNNTSGALTVATEWKMIIAVEHD